MTKAVKFWFLAVMMGLLSLAEAVSGFVLWFGFPEGGGGGRHGVAVSDLSFWGVTKHTWVAIHDWVAIALTVIVLLHIVLHWKWIYRVAKQIGQNRQAAVPARSDK